MREILGTIPREFTRYWIHRFPHLVSHSFHALETSSSETIFAGYYNDSYTFAKPHYFNGPDEDFVPLEAAPKLAKESPIRKYAKDVRQRFIGRNNQNDETQPPNRRGVYNFIKDEKASAEGWENWRTARKKEVSKDAPIAWTMPSSEPK